MGDEKRMEHIKIKTLGYGKYKIIYYSDELTPTGAVRYIYGYDKLQKEIAKYDDELSVRV